MKKIAIAVLLVAAMTVYAQTMASDYAAHGNIINHSNGVVTFPFNTLQRAKCATNADGGACLNKYSGAVSSYTVLAQYPVNFQVNPLPVFDGGCQQNDLIEVSPVTARVAGKPFMCDIDVPFANLDAGTFQIFKNWDGGYGLSTCPYKIAIDTTPWPGFCTVFNIPVP
jgi:hypothetical protein